MTTFAARLGPLSRTLGSAGLLCLVFAVPIAIYGMETTGWLIVLAGSVAVTGGTFGVAGLVAAVAGAALRHRDRRAWSGFVRSLLALTLFVALALGFLVLGVSGLDRGLG